MPRSGLPSCRLLANGNSHGVAYPPAEYWKRPFATELPTHLLSKIKMSGRWKGHYARGWPTHLLPKPTILLIKKGTLQKKSLPTCFQCLRLLAIGNSTLQKKPTHLLTILSLLTGRKGTKPRSGLPSCRLLANGNSPLP